MDFAIGIGEVLRVAREPLAPALISAWGGLCLLVAVLFWVRRRPLASPRIALRTCTLVAGVAMLLSAIFVVTAALEGVPEFNGHVDDVVNNRDFFRGKRLRVDGCVVDGSIERQGGNPARYRFALRSHANVIEATYEGEVPDTFVEGNEAVVKAHLTREGLLEVVPNGLIAKSGNHLPPPGSCPPRDTP